MDTLAQGYKDLYEKAQAQLLVAISALANISGSYSPEISKKDLQNRAYKALDEIVYHPSENAK